jgi:hypothetical protein
MALTRRVFRIKREKIDGKFVPSKIAPPPKLREGWIGKRVQGGHAPVPYRQHSGNWGLANKCARGV